MLQMTRRSTLAESELLSIGCRQRCMLGALLNLHPFSVWLAPQPTEIEFILFLLRGKLRLTGKVEAVSAGHPV